MSFLIIDGNGRVVRDFYATAPYQGKDEADEVYRNKLLHTKDGRISNAIAVSLPGILKDILFFNPDMVAVCFDKNRATFRRAIYPDYKAQRTAAPSALKEQIIAMQDILLRAGIPAFSVDDYEADDIVCTLARDYASKGEQVNIISSDHDYLQLVDENITVWRPQKTAEEANALYNAFGYSKEERNKMPRKLFPYRDATDVVLEMGVEPSQVPDVKGLAGDSSDNIPGVRGISSAAAPLLGEYKNIESIYAAIFNDTDAFCKKCKELGIKKSPVNVLLKGMNDAFLCRTLATMVRIPSLDVSEERLRLHINLPELRNIEKEWELNSAHNVITDCIFKYNENAAENDGVDSDLQNAECVRNFIQERYKNN